MNSVVMKFDMGLCIVRDAAGHPFNAYVTRFVVKRDDGYAKVDSPVDRRLLLAVSDPDATRAEADEAVEKKVLGDLAAEFPSVPIRLFESIEAMERYGEPEEVRVMRDICKSLDKEFPAGQIGDNIPGGTA